MNDLRTNGNILRYLVCSEPLRLVFFETKPLVKTRGNVKDIGIDVAGLGFDSRAGQIGRSVANGLPLPRRFFEAVLPRR